MAHAVRYLKKREGVFQYVRRVPTEVVNRPAQYKAHFGGRSVFRRSLRTKDQLAAYAAATIVEQEFDELVARAMGRAIPLPVVVGTPLRNVTQGDLDALAIRYRNITLEPFKQAFLKADTNSVAAAEWSRLCVDFDDNAERLRAALEPGAVDAEVETPADIARWVIAKVNYDAPEGSDAFGQIVSAIRSGKTLGFKDVQGLRDGTVAVVVPTAASKAATKAPVTLRELVRKYVEAKGFTGKTLTETQKALSLFEELKGNQAVEGLKKRDFQAFAEHLGGKTIGAKSVGAVVRPMSEQTIRKRLGSLCAAINFAIDRGWYEGINPAAGIKTEAFAKKADKSVTPDKRAFKVAELNKVFQHPWFTGCRSANETHAVGQHRLVGAEYWVPIVAVYSGCRLSELAGLCLSEVILEGPTPHFVIRANKYRGVKNSEARDVPILDALVDLGFGKYVADLQKNGVERLFPDWSQAGGKGGGWSNSALVRAFNRTVVRNALADSLIAGARTPVTFHNLRGSFKSMLVTSPQRPHPNVIDEVVGHEKGELDRRYVGHIPIEETYAAISGCDYVGLHIPRL